MPLINWLFNRNNTNRDLHGSARFLSGKKLKKLVSKKFDGITLNGIYRISKNSYPNCCVLGSSGMGKSSVFQICNVFNLDGSSSAVITDPSGEVYNKTAGYLKSIGYKVKVLNLSDISQTLQYNPLYSNRCNSFNDVMKIAEILVDTSYKNDSGSGDPFWRDSAKNIINLCLRCLIQREDEVRNLKELYNMLNMFGTEQNQINQLMVDYLDDDNFREYKTFVAQDSKLTSNILSTAKTALSKLSDPNIAYTTQTETLHLESIRYEPTAIFIIVNEWEVNFYSFILCIFYQQLFSYCMSFSSDDDSYLPVFFFLDEFGNSGRIPNFSTTISTIRKYRCSISILIQDFFQLVNLYGQAEASVILNGSCGIRILFSGLGLQTTEEVSRILGKKTVVYRDKGYSKQQGFFQNRESTMGRLLMTPDEIRTMPKNEILILYSNERPFKLKTLPWYENPEMIRKSKIR